ncbi:MAG: cyclase family protein [Candidatus Omnitrophica bacterium]|nr:cyclase family protein [Candidatus Omnitrophota bacterium]MDD5670135.1 cyclase family protein [Candidatus Omnitrophota bacterium]
MSIFLRRSLSGRTYVPRLILMTLFALLSLPISGRAAESEVYVDLTHEYSEKTIYWPTAKRFHVQKVHEGKNDRGLYYSANNYSGAEHGGTHFDAPIHFAENKQTAEQVPLEKMIGAAVVVDVSAKVKGHRDYQVAVKDLTDWETLHGPIPPDSIVLLRTGFDAYWDNPKKYLGTAKRGNHAIALLHFPGLSPEAAGWLLDERKIKAVGIDAASIDYGQADVFKTHRLLTEHNIPIFENLTNLEKLPPKGAQLFALPMKIKGGSGAPLRAVAVLPKV